ncbi:hypothetical protein HK105_208980 [Polyrhizophydium stewartii]|uniref:Rpr2-domain-containing protein n=1 Tax=Polyrhizophydium stewartii TaxID=2732419 RepID=A0ABR4MWC8_9FUNG
MYTVLQGGPPSAPRTPSVAGLGRMLARHMRLVSQKLVVRLDPHVKRTICRRCHGVLVPGISASVRTHTGHPGPRVEIKCLYCEAVRRLGADPTRMLFNDRNEWIEPATDEAVATVAGPPSGARGSTAQGAAAPGGTKAERRRARKQAEAAKAAAGSAAQPDPQPELPVQMQVDTK